MMTLEAALARGGLRIAAWDRSSENATALRIVAVEERRAEVIARETVPAANRAELDRRMTELGLLLGGAYRVCRFVWVFGGTTLGVWELADGMPLEGVGDELVVNGERIAASNVRAVVSFYDEEAYGHRGVKLELKTNTQVVVVEEHDEAAEYDPTYGRTNLEVDGGWITHLGRELAAALRVPHHDQLLDQETPPSRDPATDQFVDGMIEAFYAWEEPGRVAARAALADDKNRRDQEILQLSYIQSGQRGSAPLDVAVRRMSEYFAGRIDVEATASGPIARLSQPLPELDNGGYIVLELVAADGAGRLELRVESPSGARKAAEVVRAGTNAEIVTFLRSSSVADALIPVMEKLTAATRDA